MEGPGDGASAWWGIRLGQVTMGHQGLGCHAEDCRRCSEGMLSPW